MDETEPAFRNERTEAGWICPGCGRPIRSGDNAGRDGTYILHLACWLERLNARRRRDQGKAG